MARLWLLLFISFASLTLNGQADDMHNQETYQKNMTEAELKYNTQKKDIEIDHQKRAIARAKWVRSIFGILILALVILLYLLWEQVKAKQLAVKNSQILLKELHHRVKNNMQTIASMMRIQARQADPSVSAVLLENKSRLEVFSLLHQDLYLNEDVDKLNLQPFIVNLIEKFKFLYHINDEKLNTHVAVIDTGLDVETALSIGLIINELVTNSFKYAKPTEYPLSISINICKNHCHYSDNGQSIPTDFDFEKNEGFGLQLISYFAQQIHAKHRFYVDNGFHFHLTFS